MVSEVHGPTRIVFGSGATDRVGELAGGLGSRALVVCGGNSARGTGLLARVTGSLRDAGLHVAVHDGVRPEPTVVDVNAGARLARAAASDLIVAVGGGSAIDAGKAISASLVHGDAATLVGRTLDDSPLVPVIAIPTTAGSGAEVTKGAIITDPSRELKSGIRGTTLFPRVAIVDPDWLPTMPPAVATQTAFDALAHAVEGYLVKQANDMTRMWCREALTLMADSLRAIAACNVTASVWHAQARASLLGGLSVANASTGLPHRIQQAVGGIGRVTMAHGRGLAALYPFWVDLLYEELPAQPMDEVAALLGGTDLREEIRCIIAQLGLPASLRALGVAPRDSEHALSVLGGNLDNDPLIRCRPGAAEDILVASLASDGTA